MVVDAYEAAITRVLMEQEKVSRIYPSQIVADQGLHVFRGADGIWEVWINTPERDFDGLCLARGNSKAEVLSSARTTLLAVAGVLGKQYLEGK